MAREEAEEAERAELPECVSFVVIYESEFLHYPKPTITFIFMIELRPSKKRSESFGTTIAPSITGPQVS